MVMKRQQLGRTLTDRADPDLCRHVCPSVSLCLPVPSPSLSQKQDGGHLLLRVTQLPAAEPADIVPPIATTSATSSSSSSKGAAGGQPGSTQRMAAVAAAVAGPAAAAAAAGGSSGGTEGAGLEGGEGLQEKAAMLLKQGLSQAQEQVRGVMFMVCVCWRCGVCVRGLGRLCQKGGCWGRGRGGTECVWQGV